MKTGKLNNFILFLAVGIIWLVGSAQAEILFSDTFARANSSIVGENDNLLGGTITQTYFERGTAQILSGRTDISGTTSWISPNHNFFDTAIQNAGGMTIEYDMTSTSGWTGVTIGTAATIVSAQSASYVVIADGNIKPTSFLLKSDASSPGGYQCFSTGSTNISGDLSFDDNPVPGEIWHVKVSISGSFAAGSQAVIRVEVSGNLDGVSNSTKLLSYDSSDVDGDGSIYSYRFTWPSGDNYLVFEGNKSINTVDNLIISTYEPGLIAIGPVGLDIPPAGQHLRWQYVGAGPEPNYDVYLSQDFGEVDQCNPAALVASNVPETVYPADGQDLPLSYNQAWYWKVKVHGGVDETEVISFATETMEARISLHPPKDLRVDSNETVEISVISIGAETHQWYKDGVPLSDSPNVSGTDTTNFIITQTGIQDEGYYQCQALSPTGNSLSPQCRLMIRRRIAHWQFENDLTDSEGNWDAVLYQSETGSPATPVYVDGPATGMALDLSGTSQYLDIPSDSTGYFNFWPYGLTLSFWMKASSPHNARIVNKQTDSPSPVGFEIGTFAGSGHAFLNVHERYYIENTFSVCDGQWHQITGILDAEEGRLKLMVDGQIEAVGIINDFSGVSIATANLTMGMRSLNDVGSYDLAYNGILDDVMIYNYAVDPYLIAHQYADISGQMVCVQELKNDMNGDCKIDLADLSSLALYWLTIYPGYPFP